jgi:hypothetical protein
MHAHQGSSQHTPPSALVSTWWPSIL